MPPNNSNSTTEIVNIIQSYNAIMLLLINMYNNRRQAEPNTPNIGDLIRSIIVQGRERGLREEEALRERNEALRERNEALREREEREEREDLREEDVVMSFLIDTPATTTRRTPPTMRQIFNNTHVYVYNSSVNTLVNTTCPISHLEFENGDVLCELVHCHHVFKYSEIMRWLDIDSTCPVCRCSITPSSTI